MGLVNYNVRGEGDLLEGLKLLFVFVLIMLLLWRRVPLGAVMFGASLILAALYHTKPLAFLNMAWQASTSWATLELIIILALIMILEHLLGQEGYLNRMLAGLRGLFRDRRIVMALLPAFIGLMPSAGGALFSAPLVGQAADGTPINAEEKSFVNYYYRHIWEYFLPLYPGVLLASQLSGLGLTTLIGALAPFGLLVILFGLPVLRRVPAVVSVEESSTARRTLVRQLFFSIFPVLIIVTLVMVLKVEVALAVASVLVGLFIRHRYTPRKFWDLSRRALVPKTLILVWVIMLFKEVLVETRAVEGLAPLLAQLPVPSFVIFGIISFITGVLTGLTVAYIGIVFPLAMAAFGGHLALPLAEFLFVTGFAGIMLSPMHLCLALTVDYFKADLRKVLRTLLGPEAALLATVIILYLIRGA